MQRRVGRRGCVTDPRELQDAKLIAAGMPGRAVADRLDLSLRTVNNHLGRFYAKLGVSGRHTLAQILTQPPEQKSP
ncbi:helix-turn-helix transcriptional regulator [Sphaerisporangium sp. NPDC049002]|uniref:helix-turn-helix domain-containing protein n=1 Tax=Sphaerisporangium sp. NPDC049002 TaxID=3155392 RepID=UPI0033C7F16F